MGNVKVKVKVSSKPKRKSVKPKFSSGECGFLTAKIVAAVNKNKTNK